MRHGFWPRCIEAWPGHSIKDGGSKIEDRHTPDYATLDPLPFILHHRSSTEKIMRKLILAIVAALLIGGLALFALNRTSHAPEKISNQTAGPSINEQSRIDESKIVDLTYSFDENTVYWPTAKPFQWEKESWGRSAGGYWYSAARYAASEHGGTHLDAPIHFGEGRLSSDEIPGSRLVSTAIVIDISGAAAKTPDY